MISRKRDLVTEQSILNGIQTNHGDGALDARLIAGKAGIGGDELLIERVALVAAGDLGASGEALALDFDADVGVRLQIVEPRGRLLAAPVRGDDQVILAVTQIAQRRRPRDPAFAPGRRQQQHDLPAD